MLSYQVESFGKPLAQKLRETPEPQGSEVLLKIGCCGVCHSDVHLHDGYFDLGGGNKLDLTKSVAPPRTLGHEIVGTVIAVGTDARGAVDIGAKRVVFPWIGCGRCSLCTRGLEHLCGAPQALGVNRDGGFADHVLVPHPRVLLDFAPLADEQACTLACAGLTAFSALKKVQANAKLGADDPLLIIGAGGVGLSGIRLARQMLGGAIAPIVAERDASKWDTAREAGAGELIDPTADGAGKALMKSTGGGVAAVVDFVGSGSSFAFAFGAARKGGVVVSVGLLGGSAPLVPAMLSMKAVSLIGSYVGSLEELKELLAIAKSGALAPMPLLTRPLADASNALDDLREGRIKGRAVLRV